MDIVATFKFSIITNIFGGFYPPEYLGLGTILTPVQNYF
jgi:hypothetical protein